MKKSTRIIAILTALIMLFSAVSCSEKSSGLTYGGKDVSYNVLRYLIINSRGDIEDKYGSNVWTSEKAEDAEKELEDEVFSYIESMYSVVIAAEENGITMDDEVLKEEYKAQLKYYTDALESGVSFEDDLKSQSLTEDAYEFISMVDILKEELYYKLSDGKISDITAEDFMNDDGLIRVKQVLIKFDSDKYDDPEKTAASIAEMAKNGADFDGLIKEYGEDLMMFSNDDGYYIFKGIMYRAFEDAAYGLAPGDVSGVVKTDVGYSIIKRLDKEEDYVASHLDSIKDDYCEALLYAELDKITDNNDVVQSDDYSKINLIKLK